MRHLRLREGKAFAQGHWLLRKWGFRGQKPEPSTHSMVLPLEIRVRIRGDIKETCAWGPTSGTFWLDKYRVESGPFYFYSSQVLHMHNSEESSHLTPHRGMNEHWSELANTSAQRLTSPIRSCHGELFYSSHSTRRQVPVPIHCPDSPPKAEPASVTQRPVLSQRGILKEDSSKNPATVSCRGRLSPRAVRAEGRKSRSGATCGLTNAMR